MTQKGANELTTRELRNLLIEIEQLNEEEILPLSVEEVAEIEASYQPHKFSAEREQRHQQQLEELRQQWVSEFDELTGLFSRAAEIGIRRGELAHSLRLSLDLLLKLELRLIIEVPFKLASSLANALDVDIRSVLAFLAPQEPNSLHQLAAASPDRPAPCHCAGRRSAGNTSSTRPSWAWCRSRVSPLRRTSGRSYSPSRR